MSIAPIDYSAFQRNPVGIEAVLARGGSALSSILRDAMQVGRDRANRQAAQEKDFLSERTRIENLEQRRGEVALDAMQKERAFGEGVRQFDTRMAEEGRRFDVSSGLQREQLGLQEQAAERDKMRLTEELSAGKFERENLAPLKLETERTRIAAEGEKAKAEQSQAEYYKQTAQEQARENADVVEGTKLLQQFDQALTSGNVPAAQGFARTLLDPRYKFSASTQELIATQAGLPLPQKSSASTKKAEIPITDMTDDALETELSILDKAPTETASGLPSEDTAIRREALRVEKVKRQEKGVYKPNPVGSVDATSVAEKLRRAGQAARGQ